MFECVCMRAGRQTEIDTNGAYNVLLQACAISVSTAEVERQSHTCIACDRHASYTRIWLVYS